MDKVAIMSIVSYVYVMGESMVQKLRKKITWRVVFRALLIAGVASVGWCVRNHTARKATRRLNAVTLVSLNDLDAIEFIAEWAPESFDWEFDVDEPAPNAVKFFNQEASWGLVGVAAEEDCWTSRFWEVFYEGKPRKKDLEIVGRMDEDISNALLRPVVHRTTAFEHACRLERCDMVRVMLGCRKNTDDELKLAALLALNRDNYPLLREAVRRGFDVNATVTHLFGKQKGNWRALHLAALWGRADATRLLLAHGANPDSTGCERGLTPLHCAAMADRAEVARLLIDADANVNAALDTGETPLHFAKAAVGRLLVRGGADVHRVARVCGRHDGVTPLFAAASNGRQFMCALLLQAGARPTDVTEHGWTPLHAAVSVGDVDTVAWLLRFGAPVDVRTTVTFEAGNRHIPKGSTPLHCATRGVGKEQTDIVKMLLRMRSDIQSRDGFGYTPLLSAAKYQNRSLLALLVANGADVTDIVEVPAGSEDHDDKIGWNALFFAALRGNAPAVKYLLGKGLSANSRVKTGLQPIHLAVMSGSLKSVAYLVQAGADLNAVVKYKTVLDSAAEHLIPGKSTPLHCTARGENPEQQIAIAKLLLARGADKTAEDVQCCTPGVAAAFNNRLGLAKVLGYEQPFKRASAPVQNW